MSIQTRARLNGFGYLDLLVPRTFHSWSWMRWHGLSRPSAQSHGLPGLRAPAQRTRAAMAMKAFNALLDSAPVALIPELGGSAHCHSCPSGLLQCGLHGAALEEHTQKFHLVQNTATLVVKSASSLAHITLFHELH